MAGNEQAVANLRHQAQISMAHAKTPLELIQAKVLARGPASFKTFQRRFLIMDDDRSRTLNYEEFKYGLQDIGVHIPDNSLREAFQLFDKDGSGNIDMTEFLSNLRPPMNKMRANLVRDCFLMMDQTGDRTITVEDLVGHYNVKRNTKYLSGEWTERKCYEEFLKTFEAEKNADGQVTEQEFHDYYACLSASIDNDAYFRLMMRNSWKHLDQDGIIFKTEQSPGCN